MILITLGHFFEKMHATLDSQLVKVNTYFGMILQYVANDSEIMFNELYMLCLRLLRSCLKILKYVF